MSIYTDTVLREILISEKGGIRDAEKINLYPFLEESLTPIGYDLRIGDEYSLSSHASKIPLKDNEEFSIRSNETVFIKSLECLTMPGNKSLSGLVLSKVSITGKDLNIAATTIDPDWSGYLLIVMHNQSKNEIKLKKGQQICTAVFIENKLPSTKPSNKDNNRNDLLINNWNDLNNKTKQKRAIKKALPSGIIIFSLFIGYYIFGNAPGLAASVAVGVALSNFFSR